MSYIVRINVLKKNEKVTKKVHKYGKIRYIPYWAIKGTNSYSPSFSKFFQDPEYVINLEHYDPGIIFPDYWNYHWTEYKGFIDFSLGNDDFFGPGEDDRVIAISKLYPTEAGTVPLQFLCYTILEGVKGLNVNEYHHALSRYFSDNFISKELKGLADNFNPYVAKIKLTEFPRRVIPCIKVLIFDGEVDNSPFRKPDCLGPGEELSEETFIQAIEFFKSQYLPDEFVKTLVRDWKGDASIWTISYC